MAKIKVDHGKLRKTAADIDNYISKHKKNMQKINTNVISLNKSWQGKDYNQVKTEWAQMMAKDSTSGKMLESLENYSSFLKYAAKTYMDTQSKAINRANLLPK